MKRNVNVADMSLAQIDNAPLEVVATVCNQLRDAAEEANNLMKMKQMLAKLKMREMWKDMWKGIDHIYHVKEANYMHGESFSRNVFLNGSTSGVIKPHITIEWPEGTNFKHRVELIHTRVDDKGRVTTEREKFYDKDFSRFYQAYWSDDETKRDWAEGVMMLMVNWKDVQNGAEKYLKEELQKRATPYLKVLKFDQRLNDTLKRLGVPQMEAE